MIVAVTGFGCEKTTVDQPKDLQYFMKIYGNYFNDHLCDVDVDDAEEIALAGYRTKIEGLEEGWLICTDAQGMVKWEKSMAETFNTRGYGARMNDGVYFAACQYPHTSGMQKGIIFHYADDGNLIDSASFDLEVDAVKDIKFLEKRPGNQFMVHVNLNNQDAIYIYEMQSDTAVNLISANSLFNELSGRMYFYEKDDESLFLTGSVEESSSIGEEQVRTNMMFSYLSNDNVLWSYPYGEIGITEKAVGVVFKDDVIYVAGNKIVDEEGVANNVFILELNEAGQIVQNSTLSLKGNNKAYSMITNRDDELVFVGEQKIDEKNVKIFMGRTTFNGEVLLQNEYGDKGISSGRFVMSLPGNNSGFLIAGNLSTSGVSPDANDILVIKVNENGDWIE